MTLRAALPSALRRCALGWAWLALLWAASTRLEQLAPWQWLALFAVNVLGVLPFAAIGLLIATLCSGQASPAIINLIYQVSFILRLYNTEV